MAWPLVVGALIVMVVLYTQRGRLGWEPGPVAIAAALVVLAGLTTYALATSRDASSVPTPGTSNPTASDTAPASGGAEPTQPAASGSGSPALVLLRYEVAVSAGQYDVFRIDAAGSVVEQLVARFDSPSRAPVDRIDASNGDTHWRIVLGGLAGWSFLPDRSGAFTVREVLQAADGSLVYRAIPADG